METFAASSAYCSVCPRPPNAINVGWVDNGAKCIGVRPLLTSVAKILDVADADEKPESWAPGLVLNRDSHCLRLAAMDGLLASQWLIMRPSKLRVDNVLPWVPVSGGSLR